MGDLLSGTGEVVQGTVGGVLDGVDGAVGGLTGLGG